MNTLEILKEAKAATQTIALLSSEQKNTALFAMADALETSAKDILKANGQDIDAARTVMGDVMIDRLRLTEERIRAMADGIRAVAWLQDPIGRILDTFTRPNGMQIVKMRVPLGVIAIIYESRPNVTSDAAALALKSGNVCILRGGKEAYCSSHAIVQALRRGLEACDLPPTLINILDDTTRAGANELMTATEYVDLLIPRGGACLIRACVENAKVPCIQTGTGICHIYVDRDADPDMALNIIENAKTSRPSVCNAAEVCLIDRSIAATFLPRLAQRLITERKAHGLVPVELRLDSDALRIIDGTPAASSDFDTEFLDYILAIKTVSDVKEAVDHIARHSTHHSDAIVTANEQTAAYFTSAVDSAAVYVNASTRFTDGGEFGLGCEIGISTQKIHARGPMGLEELTSYKYIITGNGQIR